MTKEERIEAFNKRYDDDEFHTGWYATCRNKCGFATETMVRTEEDLIEYLNTRPIEDALNQRIKDAEQHELRLTQQAQQLSLRIKELEAWQKEAVPFLKNRLSFCDKYEKVEIRKLIEQAEGK